MIYLYLKTHNVTGLQYLGKTISNDPHLYQGSGKVWKRHINKHGYNVTTKILLETEDTEELRNVGLYYSRIWNIVESKEFANIIPEAGDGGNTGPCSKITRAKLSKANTGRVHTKEARQHYSVAQQKLAPHHSKKMKEYLSIPENYEKRCKQLASNWDNPEHREKMSATISSLKWCNDGVRNYRKKEIPNNMIPGKLKKALKDL